MDMRVHEPVSHPMPEIAAFVAQMKSAFGLRYWPWRLRRRLSGPAHIRKSGIRLRRARLPRIGPVLHTGSQYDVTWPCTRRRCIRPAR